MNYLCQIDLQNFFRRAVVHKLKYRCKIGAGSCSVLAGHRPRCQFCRMQKCRNMGMKDEYINRINRQRKNAKQERIRKLKINSIVQILLPHVFDSLLDMYILASRRSNFPSLSKIPKPPEPMPQKYRVIIEGKSLKDL